MTTESQGAGTAIQQHQGAAPIVRVGEFALADVIGQQLWKTRELEGKANVLFPITALDNLPPMMRPTLTVVNVKPEVTAREVYPVGGDKFGLSKPVIMKMLNAAGASVSTRKVSDRSDLDFIEWQATVSGYTPDGQHHSQTASKTWVWSKIREQCKENEALTQRKFADEICETKAILRAGRAFLNIQTSYTKPELGLPFLIAAAVPDLDMSDPDVKKAVIDRAVGASDALFPARTALPQPSPAEQVIEGEFKVGEEQPAQPSEAAYDPLEEESTPAQAQATEEEIHAELDGKIRGLVESLGKETFGKVLAKHNVTGLKGASIDLKTVVMETAEAVKEGRLTLG